MQFLVNESSDGRQIIFDLVVFYRIMVSVFENRLCRHMWFYQIRVALKASSPTSQCSLSPALTAEGMSELSAG